MNSWIKVGVLVRYWMKGRFTRVTAIWMLLGEAFSVALVLFIGTTFLTFSSRFGLGPGLSDLGLSVLFAFFLVGLIQSGFNGSGLPVTSADVDYVFTSPVRPRELFAAKVLMNSFTTVLLSFPPIIALYLRFAGSFGTGVPAALSAGLVTLAFFVLCLVFSADITLSLNSRLGTRLRVLRAGVLVAVAALSLVPLGLLIPGAPGFLVETISILPSGLAAEASFGLVSGVALGTDYVAEVTLLGVWLVVLLWLGAVMSNRNFYEVLQVRDRESYHDPGDATPRSGLRTTGRTVWSVVRSKERLLMNRTKETRTLVINALFLAAFMIIYSLSGIFLSSPASFLFLLFVIGSFGSGNATRWLEKERLWLVKVSSIDLVKYVREVYRARVTPLLIVLTPVAAGVGAPLLIGQADAPRQLLEMALSLPGALEVAALMMAGGMYFAARYGQSSTDDTLTSQGQDMADVRRFFYQTVINLALVSPLMGLVLAAGPLLGLLGTGSSAIIGATLIIVELCYTAVVLLFVLGAGGRSLERREDL